MLKLNSRKKVKYSTLYNASHKEATKHKNKGKQINKMEPGPRLNIKTVLSTYGDFHVKDKTAVRTSYL